MKLHRIDLRQCIDEVFELDARVASKSTEILPLDTPAKLLQFLEGCDTYLLRSDQKHLLGYIALKDGPFNSLEIVNVGIDPEAQGSGCGRYCIEFSEETAKRLGKSQLHLVTSPRNLPAVAFYKRLGFSITSEIESYYGDGEARYVMDKRLSGEET